MFTGTNGYMSSTQGVIYFPMNRVDIGRCGVDCSLKWCQPFDAISEGISSKEGWEYLGIWNQLEPCIMLCESKGSPGDKNDK